MDSHMQAFHHKTKVCVCLCVCVYIYIYISKDYDLQSVLLKVSIFINNELYPI